MRIGIPNPDRLTDGNRDDRYEEYEFTAYSRTRSGDLRELDNIVLREGDPDPDNPGGTIDQMMRMVL